MKHPFIFLTSFAISFSSVLYILSNNADIQSPVEESIPIVLAVETELPTPTPSTTPTPKPTILKTATPKPTPTFTATPIPTITPTPVPTATPDVWSPPDMEPIFARYAGQYGVDKNILERLANCESHFNPNAKNGDYLGMFQFSTNTWKTNRTQIGADTNPELRTHIEESIRTAAYLVSQRGTSPWPACLR